MSGSDMRTSDTFLHPPPGDSLQQKPSRSFREVLVRVMAVQVISLAVLWWMQVRYGR